MKHTMLLAVAAICVPAVFGHAAEVPMQPFPMDWTDNTGGLVDLSSLLDAPAGADGHITIRDGHLVKPDGSRLRIWGINITGKACFPTKEDAPVIAAYLARHGLNAVRFHFLDSNWGSSVFPIRGDSTRTLDPAQLDKFDFFVAELKKRGIYTNINLNVGRTYRKGDGVTDYDKIGFAKAVTHFDDRLIELQKEYSTQLLTHRNPYTDSTYADEPAVVIVEIVNENSLVEAWFAGRLKGLNTGDQRGTWVDTTAHYAGLLTQKYNDWLREHLSADQLAAVRRACGVGPDELVPRLSPEQFNDADDLRFHTEAAFYMHTEDAFFQTMYRHIKDTLGAKAFVVGSSDHNHWKSGYPLLASTSKLDIVDGHVYWQHPNYITTNDGRPGFTIQNTPMVDDPLNSTVVQLSRSAVAGRPYTVSETNHPFPNEYACEGIPILAAYAGFHDWDGVFLYTFEHETPDQWDRRAQGHFDIRPDPVKMTHIAAGALMFLRGDVAAARQTVLRTYSPEHVRRSIRQPSSERPYFTPGFSLALPLVHGSRIESFDGVLKTYPDPPADSPITSDTGQIKWFHGAKGTGLVAVDTPSSQALIGFVKDRTVRLSNLAADVNNRFCSIVLTSCDGLPIPQSRRLLLAVTARSANSGMRWNENRTSLEAWGGPPALIEPVQGLITLVNLQSAASARFTPMDNAAKPIGPAISAVEASGYIQIAIGQAPTTWYLIEVER